MQSILVYIVFAGALAFMAWKFIGTLKHKHKPGCPNCSPSELSHKTNPGK